MPTGYTYNVGDGTLTEFRDFAMQCARAFGALVMMRDEPSDAPIQQQFEPSDYNLKEQHRARERLAELTAMSDEQRDAAFKAEHTRIMAKNKEARENHERENARYRAMLNKVRAWTPPSDDHVQMKDFMIEQLTISISNRAFQYDVPSFAYEWWQGKIEQAQRDIQYHGKSHAEEVKRTAERNEWLRALRESLA